jgi:hypothetical protein
MVNGEETTTLAVVGWVMGCAGETAVTIPTTNSDMNKWMEKR